MSNPTPDDCWVLTTGETGMRSQVIGLAEATGLPFTEKQISLRAPWSWLPGHLCPYALSGLDPAHDRLAPPWPRLLISCGRRSTAASIAVRRLSAGRTRTVHVQDPQAPPPAFDLVIPMRHDGLTGENVFPVDTALHRMSPAKLAEGERLWRERLKPGGKALLGIVLGGANRHYRFGEQTIDRLVGIIQDAHGNGSDVIVTPSRRTEAAVTDRLHREFSDESWFSLWDGGTENPYAGILALSDRLVVTGESVSMVSEALATGHPVHVLPLEGLGRRHERFLANLCGRSMISPIENRSLDWLWPGCPPVDATPLAAEQIRKRLPPTASS